MAGGEPQAARSGGGDRERQSRPLDATGDVAGLLGRVEGALRTHRALGQQLVQQRYEFGETVGTLARGPGLLTERGRVEAVAARSDTEGDAPAGDVVQGDEVLGEGHRMAEIRRGDQRPQAHPLGGRGRRGQGGHRAEPRSVAEAPPRQVVIGVGGVEPERLRPYPLVTPPSCHRRTGRITVLRLRLMRSSLRRSADGECIPVLPRRVDAERILSNDLRGNPSMESGNSEARRRKPIPGERNQRLPASSITDSAEPTTVRFRELDDSRHPPWMPCPNSASDEGWSCSKSPCRETGRLQSPPPLRPTGPPRPCLFHEREPTGDVSRSPWSILDTRGLVTAAAAAVGGSGGAFGCTFDGADADAFDGLGVGRAVGPGNPRTGPESGPRSSRTAFRHSGRGGRPGRHLLPRERRHRRGRVPRGTDRGNPARAFRADREGRVGGRLPGRLRPSAASERN